MNRNRTSMLSTLLMAFALAAVSHAQPVQEEQAGIALTGKVTAVDEKARTVTVEGANGEEAVFEIDAKKTTVMSGSREVGLSGLREGQRISIDGDVRGKKKIASYVEVVEEAAVGSAAEPASPTAAGATIVVGHKKLDPATVQIGAGQSVTFRNVDKMPGGHTVTATDGSFSSPPLDEGESWSHNFDVPGVYPVRIKEHPEAEASIVVE